MVDVGHLDFLTKFVCDKIHPALLRVLADDTRLDRWTIIVVHEDDVSIEPKIMGTSYFQDQRLSKNI